MIRQEPPASRLRRFLALARLLKKFLEFRSDRRTVSGNTNHCKRQGAITTGRRLMSLFVVRTGAESGGSGLNSHAFRQRLSIKLRRTGESLLLRGGEGAS